MDQCVLVIGSGDQHFREYALRGVAEVANVLLVGQEPLSWPRQYAADVREVDLEDYAAVKQAAYELVGNHEVTGVITWDEMMVLCAAEISEELEIPHMSVKAATACRDKSIQRERYLEAGVPSPQFAIPESADEAKTFASAIGFPVVIKPTRQSSSIGVQLVRSVEEVEAAYELANGDGTFAGDSRNVLVEQYLTGPEISVDSWTSNGQTSPYVIAAKRVGKPPFFEEIGHVLGDVLPRELQEEVEDVVRRSHAALGIERALTHTELILTTEGPVVVEVNGRLGGDLIPQVAEICIPGLSIGQLLVQIACDVKPKTIPGPSQLVGIRFLYPSKDIRFKKLDIPSSLSSEKWVYKIKTVTPENLPLRLPPRQFLARAGYVIVGGENIASVDSRLDHAEQDIKILGSTLEN